MVEVWGRYACFTRPEMKVERVSYDVMTPSAARGLLEAIYWHPGMRYVIDRIWVRNPIRFTNIRRNEVQSKIGAQTAKSAMQSGDLSKLYLDRKVDIAQRAAMVLSDVRYVIEAHFELTEKANPSDNAGKFADIIRRRIEKGQCFHTPYFGCREFPASFAPYGGMTPSTAYEGEEERDLGYMLYDMDYSDSKNIRPTFFRAKLRRGVLDLRDCEVLR